jgi:hypothetical protein
MTRRGGPQPSAGINGSPHGVNGGRRSRNSTQHIVRRRTQFGQY